MSTKAPENHTECCGEKRDPRVVRTREALQKALRDLLGQGRFSEITVQDIAERATVNRATFYAHYEDKYALLEELLAADMLKALLTKVHKGDPFDRIHLREMAIGVVGFLGQVHSGCSHRREFGPLLDTTMQHTIQEFLARWIEHTPDSELKRGQPGEIVATVFAWTIFGAGLRWAREENRPDLETYVDEVLKALLGEPNGDTQ